MENVQAVLTAVPVPSHKDSRNVNIKKGNRICFLSHSGLQIGHIWHVTGVEEELEMRVTAESGMDYIIKKDVHFLVIG